MRAWRIRLGESIFFQMTNERYKWLMDTFGSNVFLTPEELKEGWHFCYEFDGLLVKGDPNEEFCGKACIEWDGSL